MNNALIMEKMKNMEGYFMHPSYTLEKKLLSEIRMGFLEEAHRTLDLINSTERAHLSKDPLRSLKNSLIISCALFARAAIEANVQPEDVFTLSDVFILHIETTSQLEELRQFEYEMVRQYIQLVNNTEVQSYSQPITAVIKHIHNNITEPITVNELAALVSKSPDYLSKLFKKEVGQTISSYILVHKVELAKYFLEFTSMKVIDIAVLLNFCNQGYFSSTFKRFTGVSPMEHKMRKRSVETPETGQD
ncbi:helix-turn-helix transcriptional regulator [Anaerotalea alkaliphila]|uniref:AraC family transcriptional regulator n=1 Tax=Anaerotalea alkaliphila TaxID=2662126 RepID=A0A7X5HX41_9FIRM|nr:AraC family transcriptional regulator [Anaerotalea alkaliphila]NDL68245.1 AraC family transcriptional regulator [Anaerotalea alkaliphila]